MRIDPRALHYGESNDPAKMAYSRMALIRRGPSAKPANSNSHAGHITQAADHHTLAYAHMQQAAAAQAAARTSRMDADIDEELEDEGGGGLRTMMHHNLPMKERGYTKQRLPGSPRGGEPGSTRQHAKAIRQRVEGSASASKLMDSTSHRTLEAHPAAKGEG